MTSQHQNSQIGWHTFKPSSTDASQYSPRHYAATLSPVSAPSIHATSTRNNAMITENSIDKTYTRSRALPEISGHTTEARLEGALSVQGNFLSFQARTRTIAELVSGCSMARYYSSNHVPQPFRCSYTTFPSGIRARRNLQNTNTMLYPYAAPLPFTYTLDTDRNIENPGQESTPLYSNSILSASQPHEANRMSRSDMNLDPTLPSLRSMMGQFYLSAPANSRNKYRCKLCKKYFKHPSKLQIHMRSHTGEKRKSILNSPKKKPVTSANRNVCLAFACEQESCGKRFSVVANLRRHIKLHSRPKA